MDEHLFFPDEPQLQFDLEQRKPSPKKPKKRHLEIVRPRPIDPRVRLLSDGAGQAEAKDGLPARVIAPHSLKKSWMVARYLNTVGRAMARKWFEVNYVELYCGPGILLDRETGEELPGSPLEALAIDNPFERYVFCDGDPECAHSVRQRIDVPAGSTAHVFTGDANDHEHLEKVALVLDPKALVILYLDPAKPNLDFSTIEFFASRFEHLDIIINLPFMNIWRSLSVGSTEWPARFLNHPDPMKLLRLDEFSASRAIRDHFLGQLETLGLNCHEREPVKTSKAPLYDIILASREETARALWKRANRVKYDGQVGFDMPPAP
jgi:three-Cys-motif partner protein